MTTSTSTSPSTGSRISALRTDWRGWNLVAVTALTAYSTGVAWQAQAVSYPLFSAVSAGEFPAYHLAYNAAIPLTVIVPGFVSFLAGVAFWWSRPSWAPRPLAGVVAGCGLGALLSTVLWAIPMHDRLDTIGQDPATVTSLLAANAVRTAFLTVSTVALTVIIGRRLGGAVPQPGS